MLIPLHGNYTEIGPVAMHHNKDLMKHATEPMSRCLMNKHIASSFSSISVAQVRVAARVLNVIRPGTDCRV